MAFLRLQSKAVAQRLLAKLRLSHQEPDDQYELFSVKDKAGAPNDLDLYVRSNTSGSSVRTALAVEP
jgi:hypothetical protein